MHPWLKFIEKETELATDQERKNEIVVGTLAMLNLQLSSLLYERVSVCACFDLLPQYELKSKRIFPLALCSS